MPGRIQTVIEREDLTVPIHRKIAKQINRLLGARHKRLRVRKHFARNAETNPAAGGYGFNRRSEAIKEKKRNLGRDPLRPNYFTGDLETAIVTSSRLTATSTRWSWRAKAHRPLPTRQRREIEAYAPAEEDDDARFFEDNYVRLAAQPWARRRRRRRAG